MGLPTYHSPLAVDRSFKTPMACILKNTFYHSKSLVSTQLFVINFSLLSSITSLSLLQFFYQSSFYLGVGMVFCFCERDSITSGESGEVLR